MTLQRSEPNCGCIVFKTEAIDSMKFTIIFTVLLLIIAALQVRSCSVIDACLDKGGVTIMRRANVILKIVIRKNQCAFPFKCYQVILINRGKISMLVSCTNDILNGL